MTPRHRAVLPLTFAFAVLLFALSWLRHVHHGTHAYDLGAYENIFYNLAHRGTPWNAIEHTHQWGNHFEIGLLWLWLPYRLAPSPAWLLALQAIAVAASLLPIDALARAVLRDGRQALEATIAMAIAPQLLLATLYDFHALTPCAFAMALLVLAIERDRPGLVWVSALIAISLREQMALAVAAAAAALLIRHGRRRLALAVPLAVFGVGAFLLQVLLIIPRYAGAATFRYAGAYGRLGGSPGAAARFAIENPLRFFALAFEGGRVRYVFELAAGAAPFAILALRSRRTMWPLVIAAPLLLVQLLNDRQEVWHLHFHYGAPVVPLFAGAAILAIARSGPSLRTPAVRAMIALSILVTLFHVPRVLRRGGGPLDFAFRYTARADALREALALIPPTVTVSTQEDIAPHLADRPEIHAWPDGETTDAWVVLDVNGMSSNKAVRPRIASAIARLRHEPGATVRLDRDGVFVLQRR